MVISRLAMKLIPALPGFWFILLTFRVSRSETENTSANVCEMDLTHGMVTIQNSTMFTEYLYMEDVKNECNCILETADVLNCSWSFRDMPGKGQLSFHVSVCFDEQKIISFQSQESVKRDGFVSLKLPDQQMDTVIIQFNMSQPNNWTTYSISFDDSRLIKLPPPANIYASIKNGNLHINWNLSSPDIWSSKACFEYQLDMGNQKNHTFLVGQLSHVELDTDPCVTYLIRMRARLLKNKCVGTRQWSSWSQTVEVKQPVCCLDPLIIVLISLGIPMMLLAILLLLRYQRVTKLLFPPIPRPPKKYKHFLEKNDPTNFSHLVPPPKFEEEITEVKEDDQHLGQALRMTKDG